MAKILIVDDDFEIVSVVRDILNKYGHEVQTACDAAEGMKKAREAVPDLIILDFHMPGANGAHLFENLRRNASSSKTPVIFMSGQASQEDIFSETCESGDCCFLAKPVDIKELRRVIDAMLGAKGV